MKPISYPHFFFNHPTAGACGLFLTSLLLSSCSNQPSIHDVALRDKVVACGSGFSDNVAVQLGADYELSMQKGEGNLKDDFSNKAEATIFFEIPEKDRLQAYNSYIKCIEDQGLFENKKSTQKNPVAYTSRTPHE